LVPGSNPSGPPSALVIPVCDNAGAMSGRFRFGLFELDDDTLELRREGTIVHLQAQPAQVLASLVRNADRTVSREELRRAVWGDQIFVDFERGLNFCISQIRSALGDDAVRPTYIRTFARLGYQFIAPVQRVETCAAMPAADIGNGEERRWRWAAITLIVLVAAIVGAGYLLMGIRRQAKQLPIVAVLRFDNETTDPGMMRLSDGLTDSFVERLTSLSDGHYAVIGNAQILRIPREQRNLETIAANLRANFVVLGQVQAFNGQTRILVHLIHMPEQTHVSVGRIDHTLTNPLDLEAEAAQKIAADFSRRLAALTNDGSPAAAIH
jgi:DNA-binding winged helix-turn-helix (wHTH) protein/TolB-like protein